MNVLDTADELAVLIEPDPGLRDDAREQPIEYLPDTLYLWPRVVLFEVEGDGSLDLERFDIRVAWAADRLGEGDLDREVSDQIARRADALAAVIRANRTGTTYEHAQVSFDFEALRGFDVRGFLAVITGYVLRSAGH